MEELNQYFNDHGLKTSRCYAPSLIGDPRNMIYIQFADTVDEIDILKFQSKHITTLGRFQEFKSFGYFAKRICITGISPSNSDVYKFNSIWVYCAASKEAALADLQRFKECDTKRK